MKNLTIVLALITLCAFAACKKGDSNNTTPTPTPTNPYYFKFSVDGAAYNFSNTQPEYISSYDHEIGGYQEGSTFFPSIGLALYFDHVPTNSEVLGLAGKTIYYNSTTLRPELQFDVAASGTTAYSTDTSNTSYNVKISSVTYVKVDTTIFNIVDVYAIKGTCNGVLSTGSTGQKSILTNGDFNFLISRVKQ